MFDIGATELLVIVIVAVLAIGPKDMPLAMRTVGRWVGKMRRVSGHLRAGVDAMVREAELEDMEREWRERNARIMQEHPGEASPGMVRSAFATGEKDNGIAPSSAEARLLPPGSDEGASQAPDTSAEASSSIETPARMGEP